MTYEQYTNHIRDMERSYHNGRTTREEYTRSRQSLELHFNASTRHIEPPPMQMFANGEIAFLGQTTKPKEQIEKTKPKEGKMKQLLTDAKTFIKEHKSVLYTIAIIILIDHFVFEGKFREKLKSLIDKAIGKLEKKVDDAT